VALGQNTEALAQGAMAMGTEAKATGVYSYAMGYRAQASNDMAVAIGNETRARSYGSIAFGSLNDTSDVIIPGNSLPTDRLFQIGNGTVAGRSNAMTVLRNGNTGLGILQPLARFHVDNGAVLFTGPNPTPGYQDTPIPPPTSGAGSRLMWYPEKAAFRAGFVNGSLWDKDNIGKYSIGLGIDTKASGYGAVAMGNSTIASGDFSSVLGDGNVASAYASLATGLSSYATGVVATSMGYDVQASGIAAAALGEGTRAKSYAGFVAGTYNDITDAPVGTKAVATDRIFQVGNGASAAARNNAITVLRNGNTGIGSSNPQQRLEVVAGPSANPTKIVIGNRGGFGPAALEFVSDYGLASQWRPGIIQSGDNGSFTGKLEFYTNGTGSGNLYGAVKGMEIRNGAVLTATGSVGSFSDERLKENIVPFTDGLNVINQIHPVQFDYKANAPFASTQTQIGIIAQELEKIAPYMVRQTTEGTVQDMRWVDHQAYIFLLINAIKEQQQQLQEANKKIADIQMMLQSLTAPKH
jgi:Hep_Hag.